MQFTRLTDIKKKNISYNEVTPLRILHVVGGMNRGGIETWLMHVLRRADRNRLQMDFLVHTTESCAYDDEIRALGSNIIPCLSPSQPWLYAFNFKRILARHGPYDIVHSHVHHYSGYVLFLAKQSNVPVCIAHSHNDTSSKEANARWYRNLYLTLTEWWIFRHATLGLGCSHQAQSSLFRLASQTDTRWQILYYGIDLTTFQMPVNSAAVRKELNIPLDAFVIGHVGRFDRQKNHEFLLKITAEIARREPKMYLLLVGDGHLRAEIQQQVLQLGLTDKIVFTGNRSDVSRLMLGAMDIFLLPSLYEGLPLVLLEAQAAGLPSVFSNVITEEVDIIQPLLRRVSLSHSASFWAEEICSLRNNTPIITRKQALSFMKKSVFNIEKSISKLDKFYQASIFRQ